MNSWPIRKNKFMSDSKSKLTIELKALLNNQFSGDKIASKFLQRIEQGELTRDENPKSHFCVMFAAYDSNAKQVFIGHHKKAGKWLFSGGHIDKEETIGKTLAREINEEWGLNIDDLEIKPSSFIAITEIDNPMKQPCNFHYDLWHFIFVDKNNFKPAEEKLLKEFHKFGWKNLDEARELVQDKNTLLAIDFVENNYFNSK